MAYLLTDATDWKNLLTKVYAFAVADGWTGDYDQSTRTTGDGSQIAMHYGACNVALGEVIGQNPILRTDEYYGGTVNDGQIYGALATANLPVNTAFWGHTGSLVTSSSDLDRTVINQVYAPFDRVWLFSGGSGDTKYVWCVVEADTNRFVHFGFGLVNKLGMTHPDVAFLCGMYYTWWPSDSDYTDTLYYGPNNPPASQVYSSGGGHDIGVFCEYAPSTKNQVGQVYVQANTLPAGFPAAGIYLPNYLLQTYYFQANEAEDWASSTNDDGALMNYFLGVTNDTTTGGVPLNSFPMFFTSDTDIDSGTQHTCLGIYPGIRFCDVSDFAAGQEITYAGDTWVVFPLVAKGDPDNWVSGGNPAPDVNTGPYGLAFKKNA